MHFVTVRDFRGKSGKIWKQLEHEKTMVITSNGKPIALVTKLRADKMDETLASVRRALALESVTSMQMSAVENERDKLTAAEIEKEIAAVRRARTR